MAGDKLWYGFLSIPYQGSETPFFEPAQYDWATEVESNYETIRKELSVLIDDQEQRLLKPYFESTMQYPPANWKTESFCYWSRKNHRLCQMFPETYKIMEKVPGLVSASINLLEPGSRILPHFGDTNAIYRCHLGLKIPGGLPDCGFRVENETRSWQDGKLLIFLDAYTHEGFNNTADRRYILLFDVMRPEFIEKQKQVCVTVLSMLTLYWFMSKLSWLRRMGESWSASTKLLSLVPFQILWYFYLPVQRRFNLARLKFWEAK